MAFTGKFLEKLERELSHRAPEVLESEKEFSEINQISTQVRNTLQNLRKFQRLSLKEIGERVGISASGVSKLENGTGDIGLQSICRYARAVNCDVKLTFTRRSDDDLDDNPWSAIITLADLNSDDDTSFGEVDIQRLRNFAMLQGAHYEAVKSASDEISQHISKIERFHEVIMQIAEETYGIEDSENWDVSFTSVAAPIALDLPIDDEEFQDEDG
ncbi:helix-turn-helix transcriptional regulator [Celeribacter sp. HF31]|uniref:helix-turn-helix domain-containing protein n=1 Tax=Celeribacter sp. HF31 TaxID=2721558 RepID=UPI001430A4EC|nr:helix-turn-helix transcriptional regulator [Celeribacter sp. HF31]NIY79196.1 helix-turn-helix transcriptional regulator [Celeribacter sp. HF31]